MDQDKISVEQLVIVASCHDKVQTCKDLPHLSNVLFCVGGLWLGPPCSFTLGWAITILVLLLSHSWSTPEQAHGAGSWAAYSPPGTFSAELPPRPSVSPCTASWAYPRPGARDLSLSGWLNLGFSKAVSSLNEPNGFSCCSIYWCKWWQVWL